MSTSAMITARESPVLATWMQPSLNTATKAHEPAMARCTSPSWNWSFTSFFHSLSTVLNAWRRRRNSRGQKSVSGSVEQEAERVRTSREPKESAERVS
eukprot:3106986-Pyramimonas_sp.AAC.1